MLNKDAELKEQRGYTNPKSFVRNDGSEVLKGEDWKRRKMELRIRPSSSRSFAVAIRISSRRRPAVRTSPAGIADTIG